MENEKTFYALIDRLKAHSEWKMPDRPWNEHTYYHIAMAWLGKEEMLKERVSQLEKEREDAGV